MHIRRKLSVCAAAVGLVGLSGSGVFFATTAAGSPVNSNDHHGIVFVQHLTDIFVESPPDMPPASSLAFGADLLDPHSREKVGSDQVACTVTFRQTAFCQAGETLPGKGEIVLEGVTPSPPSSPFDVAVTGGTGQFAGARGQAHLVPLNGNDTLVTVNLT